MIKPRISSELKYEDAFIKIEFNIYHHIVFYLQNKTQQPIEIEWSRASFVDINSTAYRVVHEGVRYIERDKAPPPTVLRDQVDGPYLFPSPDDPFKPVIKLNNAHYGALKRSKLKHFRLYDLRHTWATRAAMSGIDLVTLAAMLGHSRIQMVLRYAHPTEQHQAEAAKRLEEFNTARAIAEVENATQRTDATIIN